MSTKCTEKNKGEQFTTAIPTAIWREQPIADNPYIVEKAWCHGYDFEALIAQLSYPQMLYLMLQGELPDQHQAQLLTLALKLFITPGPRHPATRAAMNAGIGRTHVDHILPIACEVLAAPYLGSREVSNAMQFIKAHIEQPVTEVYERYGEKIEGPVIAPGFGSIYGGIDQYCARLAQQVHAVEGPLLAFRWGQQFATLVSERNMGWLVTGLAAAIFIDAGFSHRTGAALFQLCQAPGLIAHGIEKANKALTEMPFIPENRYVIRK